MEVKLGSSGDLQASPSSRSEQEIKIDEVIGSAPLASAICSSIGEALGSRYVHVDGGESVEGVFKQSLNAAIRDIEEHPRGKLFRRLVKYGPPEPDDPEAPTSDGETVLSDPECGSCVDFIYSHMVNRFKGELAELLALQSCIQLMRRLGRSRVLPSNVHLYWSELIRERRRLANAREEADGHWGNFTRGADGLLVREAQSGGDRRERLLVVHGIVEVKSMARSGRRVLAQIERHRDRLTGGIRLASRDWPPSSIRVTPLTQGLRSNHGLVRVIVMPSQWKLSRRWRSERIDSRTRLILPEDVDEPQEETQVQEYGPDSWKITLSWSCEALERAAYEMTYWYMAQVGSHVFTAQDLPRGLERMSPEEAGVNQTKHRLYVIPLRYISSGQRRRAIKLYNVYSYGYPFGAGPSVDIRWPDDFPRQEDESARSDAFQ